MREELPDYMVPGRIVSLERLPLTSNGKLDRKRLPDPGKYIERRDEFIEPRTDAERTLAKIWGELLRRERIGIDDDFFELGGHSLLAAQLTSRIRDAFGRDISLRQIFLTPTIEAIARELESIRSEQTARRVPAIVPVSRQAYRSTIPTQEEAPGF
jgi:acyl carrier protein